jgi:hypothetical protein
MTKFFYKAKKGSQDVNGLIEANSIADAECRLAQTGHSSIEVMQYMKIFLPQSLEIHG